RAHRGLHATALALTRTRETRVELVLAAEEAAPGHAHVVEHDLGGVAGADAVLGELLPLRQALRARRHDEAGLPSRPELGFDRRDHHVHVGDAAVGDPRL